MSMSTHRLDRAMHALDNALTHLGAVIEGKMHEHKPNPAPNPGPNPNSNIGQPSAPSFTDAQLREELTSLKQMIEAASAIIASSRQPALKET